MKELDYLKQKGILISQKQFRRIILKVSLILLITSIICLGGLITMVLTSKDIVLYIGLICFICGVILFIFDVFFIQIRYAAKVQLYLHYTKYPQDFENDIGDNVDIN